MVDSWITVASTGLRRLSDAADRLTEAEESIATSEAQISGDFRRLVDLIEVALKDRSKNSGKESNDT